MPIGLGVREMSDDRNERALDHWRRDAVAFREMRKRETIDLLWCLRAGLYGDKLTYEAALKYMRSECPRVISVPTLR
jgi:hypothetical protein